MALLACSLNLIAGCALNDVYHTGKDSLSAVRFASSIKSDGETRFRLHPATTINVDVAKHAHSPDWLAYASSGVGYVFPTSAEPNYRLLLSWPESELTSLSADTAHPTGNRSGLIDIKLGGLFNPPKLSEVETLTVHLVDATDRLVHQQRLTIKPALWQGDWDSEKSMERAFYQFALELAGR